MDFKVLGPVEALHEGAVLRLGGPKQRTVLAVLLAHAGAPVSVGRLIEALYGVDASSKSKRTIHTYVANLRAQVGDAITARGGGYVLAADSIDAAEFESLYRHAQGLLDVRPAAAASVLCDALSLWRGYAYADVEDRGPLSTEITRLEQLRLAALERRIEADLAVGRHRELIGELEALAEEYPLRETFRSHHMLALYRSGRQSEALRAFDRTRTMLVEDLGIEPSPPLHALHGMILSQDRQLELYIKTRVERRAVVAAELDVSSHDAATRDEALARRDTELDAEARRAGGSVVEFRGAAALAEFPTVAAAVDTASRLAGCGYRLAVDVGDVEVGDALTTGPPLIRALRLAAVAHHRQVLLSPEAHGELAAGSLAGWASRALGMHRIAGINGEMTVHQLLIDGVQSEFPELDTDRLPHPFPVGDSPTPVAGYELRQQLGSGRSGTVYRAYQRTLGREAAVRTITQSVVADARFIRRFEVEAQRVASTEHPHLAPLIDYWREPGAAYLVTRLLTGGDLRSALTSGMDNAQARQVLEHICSAVHAAHQRGLAHGSIRPENVLFDATGNPYVTDLGLATILHGLISFPPDTYTAPERPAGHPTVAGDVYSLGVLAAELLCGEPPSGDGNVPSLGSTQDRAITRATHPDPAERHPSVALFLDELFTDAPSHTAKRRTDLRNPYKGLAAFQEADAADFFGRSDLVTKLVAAVSRQRLTLVVGPSGIGKSSVVRAGLMPALRSGALEGSESWFITAMLPGNRPFDALAGALDRITVKPSGEAVEGLRTGSGRLQDTISDLLPGDIQLVLIVDQFEELYTHVDDEQVRKRFLDLMADVGSATNHLVRVVATMRADFYDRPLLHAEFGRLVADRTVVVHSPSPADLEEMIRGPASQVGLTITDGLVQALAEDAGTQPGALPLLQHALSEVFEARHTDSVDLRQYRASGGLVGSIGRRAEHIFGGFNSDERRLTREAFLRLVTVDEESDDTRRRVRRSELEQIPAPGGALDTVLDCFGRYRLLVFDRDAVTRGPTVEIAHEALIRQWDRLQRWVDEVRDDLLMRRRVEIATRDWIGSGNDPSYLLAEAHLVHFEAWAREAHFILAPNETAYLQRSIAARDEAETRRRRRRRIVTSGYGLAAVIAIVLALFAFAQRNQAQRNSEVAQARELTLESEKVLAADPELGAHLALNALTTLRDNGEDYAQATSALRAAIANDRIADRLPGALFVAVHPDGALLATANPEDQATVVVWDIASREVVERHSKTGATPRAGAFSPDGNLLAVSWETEPTITMWNRTTEEAVDLHPLGSTWVAEVKFSTDGSLLVFGAGNNNDSWVEVWSVADRQRVSSFGPTWGPPDIGSSGLVSYALRPEDETGRPSTRVEVRVADPVSGDTLRTMFTRLDPYSGANSLVFTSWSPDGTRLAIAGTGEVVVLDAESGQEISRTTGLDRVARPEWLPDGASIFVGGEVLPRVIDAATGDTRIEFAGATQTFDYHVVPGTTRVATVSNPEVSALDDVVIVETTSVIGEIAGWLSPIALDQASFASDGNHVVMSSRSPSYLVASIDGGDMHVVLGGPAGDWFPQINAPGSFVTLPNSDGVWTVQSTADGEVRYTAPPGWGIDGVSWDGTRAMIVRNDDPRLDGCSQGPSRIVSTADNSSTPALTIPCAGRVLFSPDGTLVYTFQRFEPNVAGVFDTRSGAELAGLNGALYGGFVAEFSADGSKLVTATGRLNVFDVATLRGGGSFDDALLREIDAHDSAVLALALSPDGTMAVTDDREDPLKLWDLDTGRLLGEFGGALDVEGEHLGDFHPTRPWLLVTTPPNAVRIHTLDIDELIEIARSRLSRQMSEAECRQYFRAACPTS